MEHAYIGQEKEQAVATNMDKFEEVFGFKPKAVLESEENVVCNGCHELDDTFWNAEYKKEVLEQNQDNIEEEVSDCQSDFFSIIFISFISLHLLLIGVITGSL